MRRSNKMADVYFFRQKFPGAQKIYRKRIQFQEKILLTVRNQTARYVLIGAKITRMKKKWLKKESIKTEPTKRPDEFQLE